MSYSIADLISVFAFAGLMGLFLAWLVAELMQQALKLARMFSKAGTNRGRKAGTTTR